jgi:hypothetical protein
MLASSCDHYRRHFVYGLDPDYLRHEKKLVGKALGQTVGESPHVVVNIDYLIVPNGDEFASITAVSQKAGFVAIVESNGLTPVAKGGSDAAASYEGAFGGRSPFGCVSRHDNNLQTEIALYYNAKGRAYARPFVDCVAR